MILQRVVVGNLGSVQPVYQVYPQLLQYIRNRGHLMAFGGLLSLILLALGLAILGIYTLHAAPTLSFTEAQFSFAIPAPDIRRIKDLTLETTFSRRLPEFFSSRAETIWWQMHERVYHILRESGTVSVEMPGANGVPRMVQAEVGLLPLSEAIQRTGTIYLAALLYLVWAISVYQRHRSPPGVLLAFFLLAGALYLISCAPVANRPVTLEPVCFKLLTFFVYASAGAMITLVHFTFVFPKPKGLLQRRHWVPHLLCGLLYGGYGLTVTLYLLGIIAFGTTLPLFCLLTLVMVAALSHSLLTEEDRFLKKQIEHNLMAPILVSLFLIVFQLLPVMLGIPPMSYIAFALFSLILPYALPSTLDNVHLYRQRLAIEQYNTP